MTLLARYCKLAEETKEGRGHHCLYEDNAKLCLKHISTLATRSLNNPRDLMKLNWATLAVASELPREYFAHYYRGTAADKELQDVVDVLRKMSAPPKFVMEEYL